MVSVRLNLYFRGERVGCERADGEAFSDFEVGVVRELLPLLDRGMFPKVPVAGSVGLGGLCRT